MVRRVAKPKQNKTAVLLIAPETGQLPEEMGPLARYISGKSGGLGEVITALCEGLTRHGVECHLATLNLKSRFQRESHLTEEQWYQLTHMMDPERIHLINSGVFDDLSNSYAGNPVLNASEFQKTMVNQIVGTIRARNGGETVITGSFNFTKQAEEHNAENLLVIHDRGMAERLPGQLARPRGPQRPLHRPGRRGPRPTNTREHHGKKKQGILEN